MTNTLIVYEKFDSLERAAKSLQASGYFKDVTNSAQAIVKVMAGAELGLPPFASMTGIHIIQGKPALGSNVVATLVKNDPRYDYRVKQATNEVCVIEWYENGKAVGECSFTMAEAKAAGLTGKDNWNKFPSDMLFARAITRGARRYAPGIFGGSPIYTPEELGADTDPDGYVETTARDVTDETQQVEPQAMSLELAMSETGSSGEKYGDLDSQELSNRSIGIGKALAKNNLSPEKRDEYQRKLDAIRTILAHRNEKG